MSTTPLHKSIHELRTQFAAHLKGLKTVLIQLDTIIEQSAEQPTEQAPDQQLPQLVDDEEEEDSFSNENNPFYRIALAQAREEAETAKKLATQQQSN